MTSTHYEFHFGSWFARRVALASGQLSLVSKDWTGRPRLGVRSSARHVFTRFVDLVLDWHERARQRRALLSLNDRMLHDIGVSRGAAAAEARKPFWQV